MSDAAISLIKQSARSQALPHSRRDWLRRALRGCRVGAKRKLSVTVTLSIPQTRALTVGITLLSSEEEIAVMAHVRRVNPMA